MVIAKQHSKAYIAGYLLARMWLAILATVACIYLIKTGIISYTAEAWVAGVCVSLVWVNEWRGQVCPVLLDSFPLQYAEAQDMAEAGTADSAMIRQIMGLSQISRHIAVTKLRRLHSRNLSRR